VVWARPATGRKRARHRVKIRRMVVSVRGSMPRA
jgi:hypothetical protein